MIILNIGDCAKAPIVQISISYLGTWQLRNIVYQVAQFNNGMNGKGGESSSL